MMKFKETALILAGHGSTKNAQSSRHTRETAKRLAKKGIFKEVRAGFWKMDICKCPFPFLFL